MSKTGIIRATVLVAGIYFVVVFLVEGIHGGVDRKVFEPTTKVFTDIINVLGMFGIGLGIINIFMIHVHRIVRFQKDWELSVVLLGAFLVVCAFGVLSWIGPKSSPDEPVQYLGDIFDYIVTKIQPHMKSTIYSFLAFYVASAALRAFRIRGLESAVMMVSAFVVLLSMTPETSLPAIAWIRERADANVNAAVFRALQFGALLGGITVALRTWLGIERSALFEES
jgi:hypothetical protein